MDVNLDKTECLITKGHWGYDVVMNICDNTAKTINWTTMDWFQIAILGGMAGLLGVVCVLVVCMLAGMVWEVFW